VRLLSTTFFSFATLGPAFFGRDVRRSIFFPLDRTNRLKTDFVALPGLDDASKTFCSDVFLLI